MQRSALFSVLTVFVMFMAACTTRVASKRDLGSENDFKAKDCYCYDTQRHQLSSGAFLGLATRLPQGPCDYTLPMKCGLTLDDAVREACDLALLRRSAVYFAQNRGTGSRFCIVVTPLGVHEECSVEHVQILRTIDGESRRFSYYVEVCRDRDGKTVVKRENVSEEEGESLLMQTTAGDGSP